MGIVNTFTIKGMKRSEEDKKVYCIDEYNQHFEIIFTFSCRKDDILMLYNMKTMKIAFIAHKKCSIMGFTIVHNMPVPEVGWLMGQSKILTDTADEFKDKYAAHLLDVIINA
jgi:hypothetical protein